MDGVLVVGLQHGAGEGAVAAALGAVLRRAGEPVRVVRPIVLGDRDADALHAYEAVASPATAAPPPPPGPPPPPPPPPRHAGETLDPPHLVRELREGFGALIAAVPGGI